MQVTSDESDNAEDYSDRLGLNISASLAGLTSSYGEAVREPRVLTWESLQQECKEDSVMSWPVIMYHIILYI